MVVWEQILGSSWRGKADKTESYCDQCLAMKGRTVAMYEDLEPILLYCRGGGNEDRYFMNNEILSTTIPRIPA